MFICMSLDLDVTQVKAIRSTDGVWKQVAEESIYT